MQPLKVANCDTWLPGSKVVVAPDRKRLEYLLQNDNRHRNYNGNGYKWPRNTFQ